MRKQVFSALSLLFAISSSANAQDGDPADIDYRHYTDGWFDGPLQASFKADDIESFEMDPESGSALLKVSDKKRIFQILLYFEGEEPAEGIYVINQSHAPGTVQQGWWSDCEPFFSPTCYATLTPEGYIQVPFFLFASGTVSFSFDASGTPRVVCDAANVTGIPAHVEINNQAEVSLAEVHAQVQSETYDLMGIRQTSSCHGFSIMRKDGEAIKVWR